MKTETLTYQKLRGGYYTPEGIAEFLARWAIDTPTKRILEPSCGDGAILVQAAKQLDFLGTKKEDISSLVRGVELDPDEANKVVSKINSLGVHDASHCVVSSDFFSHTANNLFDKKKFDVILGNPPFIRYQNFIEEYRTIAFELMNRVGLSPNRLTNIWVPFLVISSYLLEDDGKLGMVIPAELFQVGYAAETRKFLSDYFDRITIITFKELVFADAQQEVVLILAERQAQKNKGIRTIEVDNVVELEKLDITSIYDTEIKLLDHSSEKWTQYFLETEEISLLRKVKDHPSITMSREVLDVDVGIVTGQNKYFVISQEQANNASLTDSTEKIVGRSNHLKGTIFSRNDWQENADFGLPSLLFYPEALDKENLSNPIQDYIEYGEKEEVNRGYKCSIRKRWYIVPSVRVSDGFMLRQVNEYPKIILNEANATCTDTIHRVQFLNGHNPRSVTAAFMNSLTFAFSEITGRSYGGGVLTFEPSECEKLPLPLVGAEKLNLEHIDELIRLNDIDSVLDMTDQVLLVEGLGLSLDEVKMLRNIWSKMKHRRMNRKKKAKSKVK